MYVLMSVFENIKDCLTLQVLHTNLIHLSPCKIAFSNILLFLHYAICCSESEFKEFEPRLKSAKNLLYLRWNLKNLCRGLNPPKPGLKLGAGLNLETFGTILSGTNHI